MQVSCIVAVMLNAYVMVVICWWFFCILCENIKNDSFFFFIFNVLFSVYWLTLFFCLVLVCWLSYQHNILFVIMYHHITHLKKRIDYVYDMIIIIIILLCWCYWNWTKILNDDDSDGNQNYVNEWMRLVLPTIMIYYTGIKNIYVPNFNTYVILASRCVVVLNSTYFPFLFIVQLNDMNFYVK